MQNQHQQHNQNNALVLCVLSPWAVPCKAIWRITIAVHLSLVFCDSTCSPRWFIPWTIFFSHLNHNQRRKWQRMIKWIVWPSYFYKVAVHVQYRLYSIWAVLKWHSCHCLHVEKCSQYLFLCAAKYPYRKSSY